MEFLEAESITSDKPVLTPFRLRLRDLVDDAYSYSSCHELSLLRAQVTLGHDSGREHRRRPNSP